jgi:hypothetical protein
MKNKMTDSEKQKATELNGVPTEMETMKQLTESADQLHEEIERLQKQLQKLNRRSATRVSIMFAVPGVLSLVFSIMTQSQVLAFVGLGLTFWGALFFLVRPIAYVRGSLLSTTAITLYQTVDRIIKDLNCRGKPIYIPPYPKEVYLPQHLSGLKETVIFIPADANQTTPSIEEMATSKFITKQPKGIILFPPGSSFLAQLEQVPRIDIMRTDITKMNLEDLCSTLPQIIIENFQLAKEIEMKTENNQIHLKMTNSVYKNLYREENLKSIRLIGDPLVSAVACAIARASGKQVTIQAIDISPDSQTIQATLEVKEG